MFNSFPKVWQEQIEAIGFTTVTPIQSAAFPIIQAGQNLLGISPTGTGKTLAYLWPILAKLNSKKAQQVLILAPNTELAGQIFDVTKKWAEPLNLTAQVLISGVSQKRQIERLKKGPQILIGTPGRVFELIKLKKIKMTNVDTIILDEFDELLKDSQYQFVNRISNHVARDHQMIYFSATKNFDLTLLAKNTQMIDLTADTLDNIQHFYMQVNKRDKTELLRKLANIPDFRGLVFFNRLSDLGANEEKLQFRKANSVSLASDVNMNFRKVILDKFKSGQINLLLATDLVARGIDIDNLECVVNYEVARDKSSYTHRSGRTGRMGKDGYVITLVSHPEDIKQLKKIAPQTPREIILKNQGFYVKG